MKAKLFSFLCALCLVLGAALVLSSCETSEPSGGITDARINDKGELILVYQNGAEQNLGVVVGHNGKDGVNGKDGIDGKNGVDGKNGIDGKDGKDAENIAGTTVTITANGNSIPAATAKGLRSAVRIICSFTTTKYVGGRPSVKEYASEGSGVIYRLDTNEGDAFIITNYHVVYDTSSDTQDGISEDINVYLYGAETSTKALRATYVGGSLYYDIAILRIESNDLLKSSDISAVEVADSNKIMVGDSAIAIGNAQALGIAASVGVISVDSEHLTMKAADEKTEVTFRVIRVDAAVNQGNSGGGLFDEEGNLIGIVNAKIIEEGVESIGYAIPSNVATSIADNIIDYCYGTSLVRVQRALLGIGVIITDTKAVYDAATATISIRETIAVSSVASGSLADGKLEADDVLVSATVNDKTIDITRQYHIVDLMLDVRVGDTVEITVLRNGTPTTVTIDITEDCLTEY